jgi:NADH:ubiquinone oxidoreductase subunit 5 (subunit L)/multisubunit Na+/H+ antiporter MnhA subunit
VREFSWIIPLLPLLSFLVIILFTRENRKLSSAISIGAIAIGFIYAIGLLIRQLGDNSGFEMRLPGRCSTVMEVGMLIDR